MEVTLQKISTIWGEFDFSAQNHFEEQIISDKDFQQGFFFGKPRRGHPEGHVIKHIDEVLANVEKMYPYVSSQDYARLRLITLIHDTFKYKVDAPLPYMKANNTYTKFSDHGWLARVFASKYLSDEGVLLVTEFHDEAYFAWREGGWHNNWEKADERLTKLVQKMQNHLQLYYLFFKCDTSTGDKDPAPVLWFEEKLKEKINIVSITN